MDIKQTNELAQKILRLVIIFWIVETIIFLIIEGWHWSATNSIEILCDKIVIYIFAIWIFFWIRAVNKMLHQTIKDK